MNRKIVASAISLFLFLGFTTSVSPASSVISGKACTKVNQTVVSLGIKYKCSKIKNRNVWVKISRVSVQTPSVTPTPTPTPSVIPTPTPTPMPAPTPSATPTPTPTPTPFEIKTFDDLAAHPESISYWAWLRSSLSLKKSSASGPKVDLHLGPNTQLPTKFTQDAIDFVSRLYDGFIHPNSVIVIYYNQSDIAWAQLEYAKFALHPSGNESARQCTTAETCWGAMAEIDMKGNGLILVASKDPSLSDSNHTAGTLEAHEYTHTVQESQFVGTSKEQFSYCCIKAYLPWWIVEGNAEFSQAAAIFSNDYKSYLLERQHDTDEFVRNNSGTFTKDWLITFLDSSATMEWAKPENNWRLYDVGFLINEVLASLKGPESVMQIIKDVSSGQSWTEAFKTNFGITWEEATPQIANALIAMQSH